MVDSIHLQEAATSTEALHMDIVPEEAVEVIKTVNKTIVVNYFLHLLEHCATDEN